MFCTFPEGPDLWSYLVGILLYTLEYDGQRRGLAFVDSEKVVRYCVLRVSPKDTVTFYIQLQGVLSAAS